MRKKILSIIYCVIFLIIISVPLFFINTETKVVSSIDNRELTEFPTALNAGVFKNFESYFNDRLGFRDESILLYQKLNDKMFGILEHPLYMRGQHGHIYYSGREYIRDFQNIEVDTEYYQEVSEYLERVDEYCRQMDAYFLFVLLPDKKTIYPEFFPLGYNINQTMSRTNVFLSYISRTAVDFIYPKDDFLRTKNTQMLYNIQYDAEHWNANGEFLANSLIIDQLRKESKSIPQSSREEYIITNILRTSLHTSRFPIHEFVPVYELRKQNAIVNTNMLETISFIDKTRYYKYYVNRDSPNPQRILVIGDSYMQGSAKYYMNLFRETIFLHQSNLPYLKEILGLLQPDVFVLETVERSLSPNGYFNLKTMRELFP